MQEEVREAAIEIVKGEVKGGEFIENYLIAAVVVEGISSESNAARRQGSGGKGGDWPFGTRYAYARSSKRHRFVPGQVEAPVQGEQVWTKRKRECRLE